MSTAGKLGDSNICFCVNRQGTSQVCGMQVSTAGKLGDSSICFCVNRQGTSQVCGAQMSTAGKLDDTSISVFVSTGEVPAKRVERKCQQLENLVTAVLEVAQPGDIIVDFCSGGVSFLRCALSP